MAAATRAKRTDPAARVVVLEKTTEFSRGTCSMPYFVSGEIAHLSQLQGMTGEQLVEMGLELLLQTKALEISPHQRRVTTSGPTLYYDKLIVATGSRPRPAGFAPLPAETQGLWRLKTLADTQKIDRELSRLQPRTAAIVGGGYVGIELAEALSLRGVSVTLYHRQSELMRLHPDLSLEVSRYLKARGIQVQTGVEIESVEKGDGGFHLSAKDHTGRPLQGSFEAVALSHGIEPSVELLAAAGARLGQHGGVLVNSRGETSLSQVYACGDGVEVPNSWGGPPRWIPLATSAARLGRVCGENAAGGSARLGASRGALAIRVFEKQLGVLGQPRDWCDSLALPFRWGSDRSPFHRRRGGRGMLFLERRTGQIRGIQAFGAEASSLVDLVSLACEQNLTLEELSQQDFSYTPPLSGLWHPLYLAFRAYRKECADGVGGIHR